MGDDRVTCPACGGAGGGPFGPPGSAWDVESYECPRCRSLGVVPLAHAGPTAVARPLAKAPGWSGGSNTRIAPARLGLAKGSSAEGGRKRRASSDDPR
jgi:hypothetical protein